MRRSVGLLFIIGLLGSRCRTDNRLWIATLGTLDWSLAATFTQPYISGLLVESLAPRL